MNLLEGKYMCCGSLCDKRAAQLEIDRMQKAIDCALVALTLPISDWNKQALIAELKYLSSLSHKEYQCKTQ